jgi:hypothetical protein
MKRVPVQALSTLDRPEIGAAAIRSPLGGLGEDTGELAIDGLGVFEVGDGAGENPVGGARDGLTVGVGTVTCAHEVAISRPNKFSVLTNRRIFGFGLSP